MDEQLKDRNLVLKLTGFILLIIIATIALGGCSSDAKTATAPVSNKVQYYTKGLSEFNNKQYEQAIADLGKVSKTDSKYSDAQAKISQAKTALAQEDLAQAKQQLASNDYEGATKSLNKAISYNPGLTEATNLIQTVKQQEEANFKVSCQTMEYKVLNKNPDSLAGTKIKLQGKILQIQENGGETFILFSVTNEGYDIWDDNVAVDYNGTLPVYEDDVITVWGTMKGAYNYTSQAGWDLTVPEVQAKYIEKD